ncbi:hypothetical protein GP486_006686 [Trichoglossum hirsutum]|uniref:Ankyrin n=1 Tax=Trichoglossum hirsutum TaxID=265104 RepID=A0A9P8ID43_9PEZI|nr:hypothetical protein GP486_006686 [Trichoglossum hirsutum]
MRGSIRDMVTITAARIPLQAALNSNTEITRLLLKHGANVHLRLSGRTTVLHEAAEMGRPDIINELVQHGAKVEARDKLGRTPLASALEATTTPLARALKATTTPLASAPKETANFRLRLWQDTVPTLVKHGASIRNMVYGPDCAATASKLATMLGLFRQLRAPLFLYFLARFELPFETGPKTMKALDTTTDLHLASLSGYHEELLSTLLDMGAGPDAEDGLGLTPLEYAAIAGEEKNMRKLINSGADFHRIDKWGLTLLHRAVLAERVDIIKVLLEEGEDVNVRISLKYDTGEEWTEVEDIGKIYAVKSQLTPIQLAVLASHKESIDVLLEHHADLGPLTYPVMPLHFAAMRHGVELYEQFVKAGASTQRECFSLACKQQLPTFLLFLAHMLYVTLAPIRLLFHILSVTRTPHAAVPTYFVPIL